MVKRQAPGAGFRVHCPVEVRFRDCDAMGHVHNAVYFTYFEQSRFHHWRSLGYDIRTLPPGVPGFILARAECDFEAQASYGDELEVRRRLAAKVQDLADEVGASSPFLANALHAPPRRFFEIGLFGDDVGKPDNSL